MKFSIVQYFKVFVFALAIYFLIKNNVTGLIYTLFFLLAAVSINLLKSTFYKGACFALLFSVFAGYFLRPLILVDHPELFMYQKISSAADIDTVNRSLNYALISTVCIVAGFTATIKFVPDKIPVDKKTTDFLMDNFLVINSMIIALTILRLALSFYSGVGIKGDIDRDTTYGSFYRLLSPDMSFVVYYIYLKKYWRRLSIPGRFTVVSMILLTSYSIFITGSKTFIALFALCFFFNFIYRNVKIKLSSFVILTGAGLVLLSFSFIMAVAIKFSTQKNINAVIDKAKTIANEHTFLTIGDDITQRMMGLDGQIASYIIASQHNLNAKYVLEESYSGRQIFLQTLNSIIPKIQFTYEPNSAKIVSEYLVGFSAEKKHAGSLGLFAAVYFMTGHYFFIFNIALGIVLAFYFIFTRRLKNDDLRFILYFIGCYFILRLTLSGNFDIVLGEFVVEWIILYIYIKVITAIKYKK